MANYYVHPSALCETSRIGNRTRIWAFAHVLEGAIIGSDCNICDGVFIENGVSIGDRVTVKCGVQLWEGVVLEDDVFVGPNATFTNDLTPRSRKHPVEFKKTVVRRGASIGANATILPGLEIGGSAMIGAGAVVTRSVPPNAIVYGNPAQIRGYVGADAVSAQIAINSDPVKRPAQIDIGVGGVTLNYLRTVHDMRGDLSVAEFDSELPFIPKRFFLIYNVASREVRGEHAHKKCDQFLICVSGSCRVLIDDGYNRKDYFLDRSDVGIYIPSMIWGTQYNYSSDAVLLVFASRPYEPEDYIRDYDTFHSHASRKHKT